MIGLDFGTTNSALARATSDGVQLAEFSLLGQPTTSYRSILYFSIDERVSAREAGVFSGPAAIEQYLDEGATGRFMQSLKSLLPSRTFETTQMLATTYELEALIAEIIKGIRSASERQFGDIGRAAVVGRPVEFVGARTPADTDFALDRLRRALAMADFEDVVFEFEPVAAAYAYSQRLTEDETLLVADFGGGTSDFCVMRVGPGANSMAAGASLLATDGVGLAGDRFDARISEAIIAPELGRGGEYRSWDRKSVPIPDWLYQRLSSWHELSFLRAEKPLATLREIAKNANEPAKLGAFLNLVENNLGYHLYDHVESSKRALSENDTATLQFDEADLDIEAEFTRVAFESWIAPDIAEIEAAMTRALTTAGVDASQVDRVFMTGGTARTPAVRQLFIDAFGEHKLAGGEELTSVATGLALRARDLGR